MLTLFSHKVTDISDFNNSITFEGLQDFYRTHYHPANAIFMTYGDIPAAEQQQRFADLALDAPVQRNPGFP